VFWELSFFYEKKIKKKDKTMTELEAIKLSRNLWKELYEKFPLKKEESSYWNQIKDFTSSCPCCSFYLCSQCPLYGCLRDFNFEDWLSFFSELPFFKKNTIENIINYYKTKKITKNIYEALDKKYQEILEEEKNYLKNYV
jgi:hypothetical protein